MLGLVIDFGILAQQQSKSAFHFYAWYNAINSNIFLYAKLYIHIHSMANELFFKSQYLFASWNYFEKVCAVYYKVSLNTKLSSKLDTSTPIKKFSIRQAMTNRMNVGRCRDTLQILNTPTESLLIELFEADKYVLASNVGYGGNDVYFN